MFDTQKNLVESQQEVEKLLEREKELLKKEFKASEAVSDWKKANRTQAEFFEG